MQITIGIIVMTVMIIAISRIRRKVMKQPNQRISIEKSQRYRHRNKETKVSSSLHPHRQYRRSNLKNISNILELALT
jgi:hypothetical protein